MDIIYTKLWENYGQGLYILTKKLFSFGTFTQACYTSMTQWLNGYSAGLSRGRPGFNPQHLLKFCSFFVTWNRFSKQKAKF